MHAPYNLYVANHGTEQYALLQLTMISARVATNSKISGTAPAADHRHGLPVDSSILFSSLHNTESSYQGDTS